MSAPTDAVRTLRQAQTEHPELGGLFVALHTFYDRTNDEFFNGKLPKLVIVMEKDRANRRGHYTMDPVLGHRINLNPFVLKDGAEAAEVMAHEMVHVWQACVGRPCLRNYHGTEFHKMARHLGILTEGNGGEHVGFTNDWTAWWTANDDLELERFMLPGADAKPRRRKLLKYQCELCKKSFRARTKISATCNDCDAPFNVVATRRDGTDV